MNNCKIKFGIRCGFILVSLSGVYAFADVHASHDASRIAALPVETQPQVVEYPSEFFARYQPNTALDMVRQLPGFQLDDGDNTRGFTTAAGNILLNSRRPSVKQDSPSAILARIPASNVVRIDLIRGQVRGIHTRGQSVVANLLLREEAPVSVRWEAFVHKNTDNDVIQPGGAISLTHSWSGIDYNTGIRGDRHAHNNSNGSRNTYDGVGNLTEDRIDSAINKHLTITGNLNASTWVGETLLQLNTSLGLDDTTDLVVANRVPQAIGSTPRKETYDRAYKSHDIELGVNAERSLQEDLMGKVILLFTHVDRTERSDQIIQNSAGLQTLFRTGDIGTLTTEGIGRLEFDWIGLTDHLIQFNLEGAYNSLDGSLFQTVDTGTGSVVENIPGANTKVEEVRGDFLLKDTWSLGQFELEYGVGAEVSTITQTGDVEQERNFFFLKPETALSYSPAQDRQTRARLAREVSQLNFNDFVSAAVFQDDNLALGNPDLSPESIWVTELSHERRFGRVSSVKITAFYHWISDVEDLLPLSATNEAPGNIGDGRRWGLKMESRFPLDWVGLDNARLNIRARWQDSSVTDPVTGQKRVLSGQSGLVGTIPIRDENVKYTAMVDYRQDFEQARVAWGWEVRARGERIRFKVNELDIFNEGTEMSAFIETTRWLGIKTSLKLTDLLDHKRTRDRTIYAGQRGLSEVSRQELIDYERGRQATLMFSGSF